MRSPRAVCGAAPPVRSGHNLRRLVATSLAAVLGTGCFASSGPAGTPRRLADERVGWSLEFPAGWKVDGPVSATAFITQARCRSVFVVDRTTPGESGPVPGISRSLVQVCARERHDRLTLADHLSKVYGQAFAAQFELTRVANRTAYRSRRSNPELVFLQTSGHRIQIASSATADPEYRPRRRAQVAGILRSFRVDRR